MNRREWFQKMMGWLVALPFVAKAMGKEQKLSMPHSLRMPFTSGYAKNGKQVPPVPGFYELFIDNHTGEYVDGHKIRAFLDWKPGSLDPRWASIRYEDLPVTGYRPVSRGKRQIITTYLNTDLTPVAGTEW